MREVLQILKDELKLAMMLSGIVITVLYWTYNNVVQQVFHLLMQVVPDSLILPLRWLFTSLTTRFLEQGCDVVCIYTVVMYCSKYNAIYSNSLISSSTCAHNIMVLYYIDFMLFIIIIISLVLV